MPACRAQTFLCHVLTCSVPTAAPKALGCANGPVGRHLPMRRSRISQLDVQSSELVQPAMARSSCSLVEDAEKLARGMLIGLTCSHLHMQT